MSLRLSFLALLPIIASCAAPNELMKKLTPILSVESIEPSLPFWVDRLGFENTASVPDGDTGKLAFCILQHGSVEVMLQTTESVAEAPAAVKAATGAQFLYLEVDDIDAIEAKLGDIEIVVPRHETFYGAIEIAIRDPGGHVVTFAQMTSAEG